MDQKIIGLRNGGRFNQSQIIKYEDGTEWVYLSNRPEERFCGFLYLQEALKKSNINTVLPAENKLAIHNRQVIHLSRYCGENRPDLFSPEINVEELKILKEQIGFTDMSGYANLRIENGKTYVFDTEKKSFDPKVHEKIDSFIHVYNAIKKHLE